MKVSMIAPCGLNCALCKRALLADDLCPGCNGPDEHKPDYCATKCGVPRCEKRKTLPDRFCDQCPDYPCADIMEKETRYANAYRMLESPIGNLAYIRQHGMEAFLKRETERYTCPDCGGTICIQQSVCAVCGKRYTALKPHLDEGGE